MDPVKNILKKFVMGAAVCLLAFLPLVNTTAAVETSSGWLAAGDPELKFTQLPSGYTPPDSRNYNTDCDTRDFNVITREKKGISVSPFQQTELRHQSPCAVSTPRGMHDGVYLDAGVPAGKFAGHSGFVAMVPNSKVLMSLNPTGIGMTVAFYSAIVPQYNDVTGEVRLNLVGHHYLKDRAGNDVYVHTGSIGYSADGRWMVADSGIGLVRIDLQAERITRFSGGFTYGGGFDPAPKVAISPDGRYAAVASGGNNFKVYDISTCEATSTVTCQSPSKEVHPFLNSRFNAQVFNYYIRFASSELLTFVADYRDQSGTLHKQNVRMAPSGHTIEDISYLALGDSFSSGEGELDDRYYETGTNEPDNNCHLGRRSYPYLIAQSSAIVEFHSVACSGAKVVDYNKPQGSRDRNKSDSSNNSLGIWLPGPRPQSQHVITAEDPKAITISMSGNDIGFSNKLEECLGLGTCKYAGDPEGRADVANEIAGLYKPLKKLYEQIISDTDGRTRIYVIGYPQIVSANLQCGSNVHLNGEEAIFARQATSYINKVIKAATETTGVYYIDVEDALEASNLCSGNAQSVNGVTGGDDIVPPWWQKLPAKIITGHTSFGNESFHPNAKGHELMATRINSATAGNIITFNTCPNYSPDTIICPEDNVLIPSPDEAYFGAHAVGYVDCLNHTSTCQLPSGEDVLLQLNQFVVEPTESSDDREIDIRLETSLKPGTPIRVELRSVPTSLGTFTVDQYGTIDIAVTVPDTVTAGYHTLHLLGQNLAGENIDYYQPVLITGNDGDLDQDGIPDERDSCGFVEASGTDKDRDGLDDACDPQIGEAPADITAPTVTGIPDREPNERGWYNSDVTVSWTASDPEPSSGIPTQPGPTVASQEGIHTYTSQQSCDPLNNCAVGSLELRIDKTAPDIGYSLSPAPSSAGWNNSAVTVTFTCSDAISGVADCSQPEIVNGADGAYVVTGSVRDNAGNASAVNVFVSLDSTNPTVTQSVSPAANTNGWHNTAVTVSPECQDGLSGIVACSPPEAISTEAPNQVVHSTATDKAGNSKTVSTTVNIDKTAPALGAASWANNPKSVMGEARITVPASDNLSGVIEAEYYLGDTDPGEGHGAAMQVADGNISVGFNTDFPTGVYKVTVRAKDKAGNWSTPISDYLVVYDPFGTRMTGKRTLLPSLVSGDVLPGLVDDSQTDKAKFGFNVRYDTDGNIHRHSDFQFQYQTGTRCNKPALAHNCHSFELNATSIAWLATQGTNDSTGTFQGTAKLEVDGAVSNVVYRIVGLDGERLDTTSGDHLTLKVYAQGTDPNTGSPIYQVGAEVLRGNIKIRKW